MLLRYIKQSDVNGGTLPLNNAHSHAPENIIEPAQKYEYVNGGRTPDCVSIGVRGLPKNVDADKINVRALAPDGSNVYGLDKWTDVEYHSIKHDEYVIMCDSRCPGWVSIEADNQLWGECKLSKNEAGAKICAHTCEIFIQDGVRIQGIVLDELGRGVQYATVSAANPMAADISDVAQMDDMATLLRKRWEYRTVTDNNGLFSLGTMGATDWLVIVEAEGFWTSEMLYTYEDAVEGILLEIELLSPECWVVEVTDRNGKPLASARVSAAAKYTAHNTWEVVDTDKDGRAILCDTNPSGAYLQAESPGFLRAFHRCDSRRRDIFIQLQEAGSVSGTAWEDGEYVMYDNRIIEGYRRGPYELTIDESGGFVVVGLAQGLAQIAITRNGRLVYKQEIEIIANADVNIGAI